MGRWIIVSNRLPFQINRKTKKLTASSGGLVSALKGVKSKSERIWVGSLSSEEDTPDLWKESASPEQQKKNSPVYLPSELYAPYYDTICNGLFWPRFHYEMKHHNYDPSDWAAYTRVNQIFTDTIVDICKPDDLIWVHDYHLFLVPGMLRQRLPEQKIGFFLHIPFPSSEIFRTLPMRKEIMNSLIEADLVGFHDYSYMRHFSHAAYHVCGVEQSLMHLRRPGKKDTEVGVFPVSIETKRFQKSVTAKKTQRIVSDLSSEHQGCKLILGVDRQDYSKGLVNKLEAYSTFLEQHKEYHGKVKLIQIAVPSRIHTPEYKSLKEDIDQLTGHINAQYGTLSWTPVQYLFRGVPFETLVALYHKAHVLLVTSKRDGMNLVSLEYIACQNPQDPGVLVLSEFAGSSGFLNTPLIVNPWDRWETARGIKEALEMSLPERKQRNKVMLDFLRSYSSSDWAASFMSRLGRLSGTENIGQRTQVAASSPRPLAKQFPKKSRIILLDYDGTLVPIQRTPDEATLSDRARSRIQNIAEQDDCMTIVISGRSSSFIAKQVRDIPLALACEHGGQFRSAPGKRWKRLVAADTKEWFPIVRSIMEDFCKRTPGAFIEKKKFALSWHYRQSSEHFSAYQARRLIAELKSTLSSRPVSILHGKKVVEVRAAEANKGHFVRWLLDRYALSDDIQIIAIGDDKTDEDMFRALPDHAITVKVGHDYSDAHYRLSTPDDVYTFLESLP